MIVEYTDHQIAQLRDMGMMPVEEGTEKLPGKVFKESPLFPGWGAYHKTISIYKIKKQIAKGK